MALEHQFIYFPSAEMVATPAELGLPYEEVWFGEEPRRYGWFVPGAGPITLLYLHGNAGNISHRLEWLALLRASLGVNVFIFDYQGYGRSGGRPSEEHTYQDARAALTYLRSRPEIDPARIVYFGKSLGGAVGVQLASEEPPYRLIAQSTFTSLLDLARLHYPFLPGGLLRTHYASIDKIGQVRAPVLLVHGERDDLVPLGQAQRLYEAANEPKRLYVVPRASHNDVIPLGGLAYLEVLREWLSAE
jgi:fermentation-respiration switch protein FrsA (DUF1100 family)